MKKTTLTALVALACLALPAQAQKNNHVKKAHTTIAQKATKFWNDAKKSVNATSRQIKEEFGIDDSAKAAIRAKYMPIYSDNLYRGGDSNEMIQTCREDFYKHYPSSYIQSSVIPQTTWKSEAVRRGGQVVGYLQTMYCYILAKDGNDGYINAEYTFQRYKNVGEAYDHVEGKWPGRTRVDVLTPDVYKVIHTAR